MNTNIQAVVPETNDASMDVITKSAEMFKQKAEDFANASKDIQGLKDSVSGLVDLIKSGKDLDLEKEKATLEVKKSELEKRAKELENQEMLNKRADKFSRVFSNNQEQEIMKSETKTTINDYLQKASTLRAGESYSLDKETSNELGSFIVNKWSNVSKSSSTYANDVNPMGGYLLRPEFAPVTDQTNYTNTDKLFDLMGVSMTAETTAVRMQKFVYPYDAETARVQVRTENQAYVYGEYDNFIQQQTVPLLTLSTGIGVSRELLKLNQAAYDFLTPNLERNIRRRIVQGVIKSTVDASLKNIENIASISTQEITTATSNSTTIFDLIISLAAISTLRPERFVKPVLILNRSLLVKLITTYNNYNFIVANSGFIQGNFFNLPTFGLVPMFAVQDENLLKDTVGGEISAILMDADANKIVVNPRLTEFTIQNEHITHVENNMKALMSMSVATACIDTTRVATVKVKS
jgi:HK97 family phage major capsid protein